MKKTPTSSLVHEEIKHQTNQSAGYINAKPCTPRSSLLVGKEDVSMYGGGRYRCTLKDEGSMSIGGGS
jgi:hypothetical protein